MNCDGCDGKGKRMDMDQVGWPSVTCTDCGGSGLAPAHGGAAAASAYQTEATTCTSGRHQLRGERETMKTPLMLGDTLVVVGSTGATITELTVTGTRTRLGPVVVRLLEANVYSKRWRLVRARVDPNNPTRVVARVAIDKEEP